jgi:hypothetical protein
LYVAGYEAVGWRLETRDWRLETRDWRLETGGWRLEALDCSEIFTIFVVEKNKADNFA